MTPALELLDVALFQFFRILNIVVACRAVDLRNGVRAKCLQEGREPNGSVHDTLNAMRTLDRIEKSFDF